MIYTGISYFRWNPTKTSKIQTLGVIQLQHLGWLTQRVSKAWRSKNGGDLTSLGKQEAKWFDQKTGKNWDWKKQTWAHKNPSTRNAWLLPPSEKPKSQSQFRFWNLHRYGWCVFIFSVNMVISYGFPAKQNVFFHDCTINMMVFPRFSL